MVTDQEIAQALETLLRESNPNVFTSINGVIKQLEAKLGFDLINKHDFIRTQIHQSLLLRSQQHQHQQHHQQQHLQHQHQHQQQHQQQQQQQQHPHPRDHFALQQTPNYLSNPSPFPPQFQNYNPPPVVVPKAEPVAAVSAQSVAVTTPEASKEGQAVHVARGVSNLPNPCPTTSAQTKPKRKGGPGGLNKLCGVSPELQAIVGQPALPRTEIVKQLWAYIRKNSLQDPSNKRKIICNDELRLVFETDCTDMFKMNKLLAKHIYALEPSKSSAKKVKVEKVESGTKSSESSPIVIISEALTNFFGTGGREMPQSEVIRRVWEYIKVNHLEDPDNSLVIVCDGKLQELFGCESIPALGIPEMLARHHLFSKS